MQLVLQPDGKHLTGEAVLRLACVTAVMEHGSEQDRRQPLDKANAIYQFVTGDASETDSGKTKSTPKKK